MLLITLGDPWSINIEILSKLIQESSFEEIFITKIPVVLIGSLWQWNQQREKLGFKKLPFQSCANISEVSKCGLWFYNISGAEKEAHLMTANERGFIAASSLYSLKQLNNYVGKYVLTLPIDKKSCHLSGFDFPGQTEYFESLCASKALMLLAGKSLRVGLASNHIALKNVASFISEELLISKLSILYRSMQDIYQITDPRIAVCGMNPHCGDGGLFGDEEKLIITPAIASFNLNMQAKYLVEGPISADTIFWQAQQGQYDAVLAMYHDQGLAPLKTVDFETSVNISAGIDLFRVSPDHGPASSLYLKNEANTGSLSASLSIISKMLTTAK